MPRILARQPEVRIIIVTGDGKLGTFLRGSTENPPLNPREIVCSDVFFSLGPTFFPLSLYQRFIPISFSLFVCFVGGSDSRSTRGYYIVKPFNYLGKLLSRNIRPVLNECTIVCRGWCTFRCNPLSSSPPPRNSFLPLLFYPLRLFFVSTFFRFFDVFLSLSFHRSW